MAEAIAGFSSIFELNIFVEIPAPEPANGRSQFFVSRGEEVREESPHFKGRLRVKQGRHNREAVCSITRRVTQKTDTEKVLNDKDLQDQSRIIKNMIEDYMRKVDKTIRDLVPNYIVHFLVSNATSTLSVHPKLTDLLPPTEVRRSVFKLKRRATFQIPIFASREVVGWPH